MSSVIDERTLREIYLVPFEHAVRQWRRARGHDRLQPAERDVVLRAPPTPDRDPAGGMGVRRLRPDRLVRGGFDRGFERSRCRPRDAGPGPGLRVGTGRCRPRRFRGRGGPRRAGGQAARRLRPARSPRRRRRRRGGHAAGAVATGRRGPTGRHRLDRPPHELRDPPLADLCRSDGCHRGQRRPGRHHGWGIRRRRARPPDQPPRCPESQVRRRRHPRPRTGRGPGPGHLDSAHRHGGEVLRRPRRRRRRRPPHRAARHRALPPGTTGSRPRRPVLRARHGGLPAP